MPVAACDVTYSTDFKFTDADGIAIGEYIDLNPNGNNVFAFACDSTLGSISTRIYLDWFKYVPEVIISPESVIVVDLSPITLPIYFGDFGSKLTLNVSNISGWLSVSCDEYGELAIFDVLTRLTTTVNSPNPDLSEISELKMQLSRKVIYLQLKNS